MNISGVSINPQKIAAIPTPKGLKEMMASLGTVGCYRQDLIDFVTDAKPLNRLRANETE